MQLSSAYANGNSHSLSRSSAYTYCNSRCLSVCVSRVESDIKLSCTHKVWHPLKVTFLHAQNLTSAQCHAYVSTKSDVRSESLLCTHKVWRPLKVTLLHAQRVTVTELSARITCSIFSHPLTRIHSLINPFNLSLTFEASFVHSTATFTNFCVGVYSKPLPDTTIYQKTQGRVVLSETVTQSVRLCPIRRAKICLWPTRKKLRVRVRWVEKWKGNKATEVTHFVSRLLSWFSFSYLGKQT